MSRRDRPGQAIQSDRTAPSADCRRSKATSAAVPDNLSFPFVFINIPGSFVQIRVEQSRVKSRGVTSRRCPTLNFLLWKRNSQLLDSMFSPTFLFCSPKNRTPNGFAPRREAARPHHPAPPHPRRGAGGGVRQTAALHSSEFHTSSLSQYCRLSRNLQGAVASVAQEVQFLP